MGALTRLSLALLVALSSAVGPPEPPAGPSILGDHLLITWYGNPRTGRMGVLGQSSGNARASALRRQAAEYAGRTRKPVLMAYHLVAVTAQCTAGADGQWRRRETRDVIQALLDEARVNGFRLILDVQPGQSTVAEEVEVLAPFLREPDVDLALDPEWTMSECEVPGQRIGYMRAADVNLALDRLERVIAADRLPPKILIVHQFRLDMLPDKAKIRSSATVDVVLNMDGFGSPTLKLSSYRTVMRAPLAFAGIKLFYQQDTRLLMPAEVLALRPTPSVVVYQ